MIARTTGFLTFICWSFTVAGIAQVPEADLYVFRLNMDDTSRWHIHSPKFLSAWNPGGYTNQPEWIDDHRLLVSGRLRGMDQNEIYLLDLSAKTLTRCTRTPESEFSPEVMPDRKYFSVVRQVHGDTLDQQLYRFPLDLSENGTPLLPEILNVGYYCWLPDHTLALCLVGDPPKLALLPHEEKLPRIYSSQIGRSLRPTLAGDLAYVHKYSDDFWYIKTMQPATRRSEIVTRTLRDAEDFAISPSGHYFMGDGAKLFVFDPSRPDQGWVLVQDLSVFGLTHITRLSISPSGMIAIVNLKKTE